jgi:hypothetical protein
LINIALLLLLFTPIFSSWFQLSRAKSLKRSRFAGNITLNYWNISYYLANKYKIWKLHTLASSANLAKNTLYAELSTMSSANSAKKAPYAELSIESKRRILQVAGSGAGRWHRVMMQAAATD